MTTQTEQTAAALEAAKAALKAAEAAHEQAKRTEAAAARAAEAKARKAAMNAPLSPEVEAKLARALRAYTGKAGRCCCGCSGNYSATPKALKMVAGKIRRAVNAGAALDDQPTYVAAEQGTRLYIAYLD